MGKIVRIRDLDSSHIPPYKRSVTNQSRPKGSKKIPPIHSIRNSNQKAAKSTWIVLVLMILFIGYHLIPWENISSYFSSLQESSFDTLDKGPLIYSSSDDSKGVFTLDEVSLESSVFTILLEVKSGDSLRSILERHGIDSEISSSANSELIRLKKEKSLKSLLKAGNKLESEFHHDGTISRIKISLSNDENLFLVKNADNTFSSKVSKIKTKVSERVLFGTIQSSFSAAARKAGLSYDMIDELVDIFSDRVSFHKDFRKGDSFSLIYHEHEKLDSKRSSSGIILAAALEVRGNHYTAIRYVGADSKPRYFNEKGELIGSSFLRYPLQFSRISSHFSDGRFHPVLKVKRPHYGVDFAAPTGTPVRTIGDGVVTFAGRKGGHGIIIEIRHSDRYTTGYSHLSAISPGIVRGKKVTKGMLIGKVGMTGLATGPHLHFSLYDYGKYIDPLKAKLPVSEGLSPGIKINSSYLNKAVYTLNHYQNIAKTPVFIQ